MGAYINPGDQSKETWLHENGRIIHPPTTLSG